MRHVNRAGLLALATSAALALAMAPIVSVSAAQTTPAPSEHTAGGGEPTRFEVAVAVSGGPEASTIGRRINEAGEFTGWANYPLKAFVWTEEDGFDYLPGIGGDQNRVGYDINDAGVVVGQSGRQTIEPPHQAARWLDGVPEDIGALQPGGDAEANGVNEAGTIVGWSAAGFYTHAFVWTEDGGMIDITPSGFGWATDINEVGQVTGNRNSHAYVWEAGVLTNLEQPADFPYSFGRAINDHGQVAGGISSGSGNAERLVRWTPGVGVEVLGGGGEHNTMLGINNHGTTVGEGNVGAGYKRGVIHSDDFGLYDLNDLINTTEWEILSAYDINDAGQVLANGISQDTGVMHALRLDPITGDTMHDEDLRVTVRETDATIAVATARVVNDSGSPVRRAKVVGAWYDSGALFAEDVVDRTNRRGSAKIKQDLGGRAPEGIEFCISTVTRKGYTYVPGDPGQPPCAGTE